MSYQVGVDVGGTFTTTAVVRLGRAEVVSVVPTQLPGVPRGFLSRVGDDTPVLVSTPTGTRPVPAETLVAQLVRQVVSKIGTPTRLAVTHPVTWGPHRVAALRSALGEVTLLSTAAAVAYRSDYPTAVHDLGGSTFTAAVVRGFATVGQPAELDLGGADLDELVFDHVRTAIGDSWPAEPDTAALSRLRQACTAAKETLSSDTEVEIPVALQGIDTRIRLTRAEFEEMARPLLAETASALRMTIEESGLTPATVLLTGGAAWLPLLTQVVSAELGRPVTSTPPGAAAMGAALAAGDSAGALSDVRNQAGPAGPPAALRPVTPSAAGAAGLSAAPSASQGTDPRQGRPHTPTRLAINLESTQFAAQGEARTSVVEPVRPPVPVAAAPVGSKAKRPRTVITAAAAAFVVVGAAAGIMLTSGQKPAGAGAETLPTTTTTVTTTTDPVTTTETVTPPPETRQSKTPKETKRPTSPRTTTTTTTKPAPTTTTTSPPPPTTTTTKTSQTPPSSGRSPETTEGGER